MEPAAAHKADVFAHFSAISTNRFRSLDQGERVEFDLVETDKGLMGNNIVRCSPLGTREHS
jgi:cold shock CspA family protein